jgi:hypothetical protein
VHELVGDQRVIVFVTAPYEDPLAEGHARDPGCQDGDRRDTGAVEVPHRDVRELLALACFEAPRHPAIS